MSSVLTRLGAILLLMLGASPVLAQELLSNGDFEAPLIEDIPGWELSKFRTGMPTNSVNAAEIVGFANNPGATPGEFGLWLRAFVGNPTDGTADAILSQTVAATPGETYNLSGEASFEQNYSGGVTTLDAASPFGAVASPTTSTFELAFLDSGGSVIGSPLTQDVASDAFNGFGYTSVTPVSGIAPAGAVSVRVQAKGEGLAFNVDPGQSAFYDNFSLSTSSAPATELLTNGDLNAGVIETVDSFEFIEAPSGTNTTELAGFANNTSGGSQSVWLRAFSNGDSTVTQTVSGSAGGDYTFTAFSRWEPNYSGGLVSTTTQTLLELAFLDAGDAVIGSPATLDLTTEQMNDNTWRQHSLAATAPAGTASVRVSGIATGMFDNPGAGQSAFFDDFSLTLASSGPPGDYNGDGAVDAADYTEWRDGNSPDSTIAGYNLWVANYGTTSSASSAAVPEPSGCFLLSAVLMGVVGIGRRLLPINGV